MNFARLLPAMCVGLLNLKTYSFRSLPVLQGPLGPGTYPAVGGRVTETPFFFP